MRETLARRRRQHLVAILKHTCSADDPARGHVDAHVEASEVVIELRWTQVELRIPTPEIVVDGDARIPLRRLVKRIAPALRHAVVLAGPARHLVVPFDLQGRLTPGRYGLQEVDRRAGR